MVDGGRVGVTPVQTHRVVAVVLVVSWIICWPLLVSSHGAGSGDATVAVLRWFGAFLFMLI